VPHTLLLVDDSVTIQRVIELTFADEDVRVVAVSSGDQAIARLKEEPPDIVLADVGMPGTNGYEVARHIRQDPALKAIPVVLLSGAFEPVDQARAQEVGCNGILAKPFEPQLVIAKVRELLGQPATGSPARATGALSADTAAEPQPEAQPVEPGPASTSSLDDYFDRLDAAFATLSAGSSSAPRPTSVSKPIEPVREAGGTATDPGLPPLAEAFAALLAAEDARPGATAAAVWPAGAKRGGEPLSESTIDQIVDRVLARLSDRIGPRNIGRIVEDVAERVVREEIERLKASIP
jgi:CheY-like chemotaxis protein